MNSSLNDNNYYILGLDVGSINTTAVVAKVDESGVSICGVGKNTTSGLKKGVITNIEKAASSIKNATKEAIRSAGKNPDKIIVSIAGTYTHSVKSQGIVSVLSGEITIGEIKRAMQLAQDNAVVGKDRAILHVLPYSFKVDGQDHIEDPIGMCGSRLEVFTHVVTADENSVRNLIKATKLAGLEIDNMVLSGYASAISTLTKEEKELGVGLIDMGGATCDIVIHLGNSIIYNESLPVGSSNITMDLSKALNTPLANAEELKTNYSKLLEEDTKELRIPTMGENSSTHTASMDIVIKVVYARIEETILLLYKQLESSGYLNKLGAGLVVTGGLAKIDNDIRNIISMAFGNIPVRLAKPKEIGGLYEICNDSEYSCVIGLCLYGAGHFTRYEIDSNGHLKYLDNKKIDFEKSISSNNQEEYKNENSETKDDETSVKLTQTLRDVNDISAFKKFINRLKQIF